MMYMNPISEGNAVKIDDALKKTGGLPVNSPTQARTEKSADKTEVASTPSHSVQISNLSTQLQGVQSAQAGSAVFATKKVEENQAGNFGRPFPGQFRQGR